VWMDAQAKAAWEGATCNGFSFDGTDSDGMDYALNRAIDMWYDDREGFLQLRVRVSSLPAVLEWSSFATRQPTTRFRLFPPRTAPPHVFKADTSFENWWPACGRRTAQTQTTRQTTSLPDHSVFHAQATCCSQDWSWNRPALDYLELYHSARK
jgi:glycogen synthase